jgi:glycosyltransferase involved in cell wall biosynthesis
MWFEWRIPIVLKKCRADCFLSFDTYASTRTDVPTVIISHDIAYHHYPEHLRSSHLRWYRKWFPRYHRRADCIVAVSQYTADDIIETYNLDSSKVSVGYNACPDHYAPISSEEVEAVRAQYTQGRAYFVYIGSLHPRKNIVNLIQAYNIYRDHGGDQALVLIGHLAWKTENISLAISASAYSQDIIHLSGIGDEANHIVAGATALVYVSLFEGFGIPLLEAMAAGVPVITSSVSSMPEVAANAALIVDPKDVNAIATAMSCVATDELLQKELRAKGLARVQSFDWSCTAEIVYQACIDSNTKSIAKDQYKPE